MFVDGQLVGGWTRSVEKKSIVVTLTLQARLNAAERKRVAAAARAFGEFLNVPVELRSAGNYRYTS